ncbi:hypothetical protein BJ138DRAFT_1164847 [Hygrophoropsis aurantiaca]|uniref:Uncharacterized protein n=1 Tax=Hygrophoropsis aurantiaca TaxID=72124 RepID=A0ACB7ZWB6_9AGAM|nr:hypothetical protein BJ138DRAFT_1164847 [Hygrophoropsis aurantiaca]
MHRCLRIPGVLVQICEYLAVIEMAVSKQPAIRSRKATTALAAFARTCKTTQNPALDVLWANLDYYTRLIQCLPGDLWKVQEESTTSLFVQSGQPLKFQRPMTLSDWRIFNKYAYRVRSLAGMAEDPNEYVGTVTISPEALLVLSCPPSFPLLPNLRSLTWSTLSPPWMPLLWQLLSPKITRLAFRLEHTRLDHYVNSALSLIGNVCPQVSDFALYRRRSAREKPRSISSMSQVVESLHHLRTLKVNVINGKAIAHLASLPSLTSASFALDMYADALPAVSALPTKPFPMLATLVIRARSIRYVEDFLLLVKISPTFIDVRLQTYCRATHTSNFFATLSNSCRAESLETLIVHECTTMELLPWQRSSRFVLGVQDLRPLFRLTRLRVVQLELACNFDIDDAVIEELARAWPELTSLHMNENMGWAASKITYQGLLALLNHCTKLSSLSIDIDFRSLEEMPVPSACPCNGLSNKLMEEMSLGNSRIDKPANVAAFMSAVLPNLREVKKSSSAWSHPHVERMGERYKANWEMFDQLLPIFVATRAQEKACSHMTPELSCKKEMNMESLPSDVEDNVC